MVHDFSDFMETRKVTPVVLPEKLTWKFFLSVILVHLRKTTVEYLHICLHVLSRDRVVEGSLVVICCNESCVLCSFFSYYQFLLTFCGFIVWVGEC